MSYSTRTGGLRAKSAVSQAGAGERITSKNGMRWAISRNRKRRLPDRTFDVVKAWVLKGRREDGSVFHFSDTYSESVARDWIASGETDGESA